MPFDLYVGLFLLALALLGAFLNHLRGGGWKLVMGRDKWWNGSVASKVIWAIPTSILLFFLTTPDSTLWYRVLLLIGSSFGMWALWGSGAHSIMSFHLWKRMWELGQNPDDTELYTKGWLPWLFKGTPHKYWDETEFWYYHIIGKSCEGLLRMATMLLPIMFIINTNDLLVILFSGVLWGPVYWLTWQISDTDGWRIGEWVTGGLTYLAIGLMVL